VVLFRLLGDATGRWWAAAAAAATTGMETAGLIPPPIPAP
jgi:hypothetical protein